jgi:hypothetical protein
MGDRISNLVVQDPVKTRQKSPEHGTAEHGRQPSEANLRVKDAHNVCTGRVSSSGEQIKPFTFVLILQFWLPHPA